MSDTYSERGATKFWIVIVTYRRKGALAVNLSALASQSARAERVVVVDNANDRDVAAICQQFGAEYVPLPDNAGPAGGTAVGMQKFVAESEAGSWLVRIDDDRPPPSDFFLEDLVRSAEILREQDPRVGAVGYAGARLDRRRWRLSAVRPTDIDPVLGIASENVDYLATGHYPCWSREAIVVAGPMDSSLFFGLTEVDYGLRMRQLGIRLVVLAPPSGVPGLLARERQWILSAPVNWRYYYSVRNNIVLCRRYSGSLAALRISVFRFGAKLVVSVCVRPRIALPYVALGIRAISDAWSGRLGRQVDPWAWSVKSAEVSDGDLPNT